MEIKTLKGIKTNDILNVFNEAFSDYFIPFQLTQEQLASKMLADKVRLDFSVGVFEDEKLIAFILHGFDSINGKKIIYNGGTGVIPSKRGSRLTKQMHRFILPILKEAEIDQLLLEVISNNTPAIKSYEKSGYKIERHLCCYNGKINSLSTNNEIEIRELQDYNWGVMQSFWDVSPTWQNSNNVLDKLKEETISIGAYIKKKLIGYIIYNPKSKRLHQIAVDKNDRQQKVASTLLQHLINEYDCNCSIINVDKSSNSMHEFLLKIGLQKTIEQLEMKLTLDAEN